MTDRAVLLRTSLTRADTRAVTDAYWNAGPVSFAVLRIAVGGYLAFEAGWWALAGAPLLALPAAFVAATMFGWRPLLRWLTRLQTMGSVPADGMPFTAEFGPDGFTATVSRLWMPPATRRFRWGAFRAWYETAECLVLLPWASVHAIEIPMRGCSGRDEALLRALISARLRHSVRHQHAADRAIHPVAA